MQLAHEIATSRYLYGRDRALSFQALPYRSSLATWDVTTYNLYATRFGLPAYDPAGILAFTGYDPAKGGVVPYPSNTTPISRPYFLPTDGSKTPATDSASAATTYATGYKTDDGNLAWLPGDPTDGALETIAETLRDQKGFAIGVVSTVPFTHATPAAFVSHNVSRSNYHAIGKEILEEIKPEVVIGGGFPAGGTYLSVDTLNAVKADASYVVVERQAGVDGGVAVLEAAQEAAASGRKLFGLFGGSGGNFESPVAHDLPGTPAVSRGSLENPLLSHATNAALKVLSQDPDGFFVMIEQGDIDWANHANDYQRMVGTTWDLHEAVRSTVDFVNRHGDDITWDNTLLIVTSDHANSFMRFDRKKRLAAGDLPRQDGGCSYGSGLCTYPDGEVSYGTGGHTNELIAVYAIGRGTGSLKAIEGSWYPCTRIIDNTQVYNVMTEAAGAPQPSALHVIPQACRTAAQ